MVRYRRNFVAGGTFFFTVTLADRASRALIDHIEALRAAVREIRAAHPFAIDAVVILPDHIHIVMTLPEGDFSPLRTSWVVAAGLGRRVRARSSKLRRASLVSPAASAG